jgi:hypothetical protein
MDPDPGGSKIFGSEGFGSATLAIAMIFEEVNL